MRTQTHRVCDTTCHVTRLSHTYSIHDAHQGQALINTQSHQRINVRSRALVARQFMRLFMRLLYGLHIQLFWLRHRL